MTSTHAQASARGQGRLPTWQGMASAHFPATRARKGAPPSGARVRTVCTAVQPAVWTPPVLAHHPGLGADGSGRRDRVAHRWQPQRRAQAEPSTAPHTAPWCTACRRAGGVRHALLDSAELLADRCGARTAHLHSCALRRAHCTGCRASCTVLRLRAGSVRGMSAEKNLSCRESLVYDGMYSWRRFSARNTWAWLKWPGGSAWWW